MEPVFLAESQIVLASCEKLVFVAACVEASQMVNKMESRTSVMKATTRARELPMNTKDLTPPSLRRSAENAVKFR